MTREEAVLFDGPYPLGGVLTTAPEGDGAALPCVLILNAGLVHHVGPNRLAVKIARELAPRGFTVVRFDHAGMGDSANREDTLPFETAAVADVRQVMDRLGEQRGIDRFVLVGLCSGAQTAFRTASVDERAIGAALINGGIHSEDQSWNHYVLNRKSAREYWRGALLRLESWKQLLTGRSQYRRLATVLWRQLRSLTGPPPEVASVSSALAAEIRSITERGVRLISIHSQGDLSLDDMAAILGPDERRALEASGRFRTEVISCADHTFTLHRSQRSLLQSLDAWVWEQFAHDVPPNNPRSESVPS